MRLAILTLVLALPAAAYAQNQPNFAAAAAGLGVSEAHLRGCMSAYATPGEQPTMSQRRAIFDCVKQANPDLTVSQARSAMSSMRP